MCLSIYTSTFSLIVKQPFSSVKM